jgi:hypothetical protein
MHLLCTIPAQASRWHKRNQGGWPWLAYLGRSVGTGLQRIMEVTLAETGLMPESFEARRPRRSLVKRSKSDSACRCRDFCRRHITCTLSREIGGIGALFLSGGFQASTLSVSSSLLLPSCQPLLEAALNFADKASPPSLIDQLPHRFPNVQYS